MGNDSAQKAGMMASIIALGAPNSPLAELERRRKQSIELARASGVSVWTMDDLTQHADAKTRTCDECGGQFTHDRDYCSAECCRKARQRERLARIASRKKKA